VGVPPEEGDYWEPDPGPEDGCAVVGPRGDVAEFTSSEPLLGSMLGVSCGAVPGLYVFPSGGGGAPTLVLAERSVLAIIRYDPRTLEVVTVSYWGGTSAPLRFEVLDTEMNLLLYTEVRQSIWGMWNDFPRVGGLVLDPTATYWLRARIFMDEGYLDGVSVGGPGQEEYSAWLPTEQYGYCDLVAYPVPDTSRHVLPLLKRTALGEGTLIPGGAALCR